MPQADEKLKLTRGIYLREDETSIEKGSCMSLKSLPLASPKLGGANEGQTMIITLWKHP
jgi:hypothetical protein